MGLRISIGLCGGVMVENTLSNRGRFGVFALLICGGCAGSFMPAEPQPLASAESRVHIMDARIAQRMTDLEMRSPQFHAAMAAIRLGGIDVYVGTPGLIEESAPALGNQMAPQHLGEFGAVVDTTTRAIRTLFVRIDLQRIAAFERSRISPFAFWVNRRKRQAAFDELVDAILIHEMWGHLVPVAEAGSLIARCDDPVPGERELDSCVMKRENELRRYLGLRPRSTYAL